MSDQSKEFSFHNYSVGKVLSQTSYSTVRQATNLATNSVFALKILSNTISSKILFNETVLTPLIAHPNIVEVTEIVESENHTYLFTPLAEYGDLLNFLRKSELPLPMATKVICQILTGIEALHSLGICHRDLRPENILMFKHAVVKISGLGAATVTFDGQLDGKFGSIEYSAPEVIENKTNYDGFKADMWSIGVLMYVILARRQPFKSQNSSKQINNVNQVDFSVIPKEFISLIKELMSADPDKRPSAAQCKMEPIFEDFVKNSDVTNIKPKPPLSSIGHDNTKQEETLMLLSKLSQALGIPYSDILPKVENGGANQEKLLLLLFRRRINREKQLLNSAINTITAVNNEQKNCFVAMPSNVKNVLVQKVGTYLSPAFKVYSVLQKYLVQNKISISTPLSDTPVIIVRNGSEGGKESRIAYQVTDSQDGKQSNLVLWCDVETAGLASRLLAHLEKCF